MPSVTTSSPYINTKEELKDFILRRLGSPVINVELTSDQLEDAIQESVERYIQVGYSGVEERYYELTLNGSFEYQLPYPTVAVLRAFDIHDAFSGIVYPLDFNYEVAQTVWGSPSKISLLEIEMTKQFIESLKIIMSKQITFDFNSATKTIRFFMPTAVSGEKIVLHLYRNIDIQSTTTTYENSTVKANIFNTSWIKRFAVELGRRQWAYNMLKYEGGSLLPNGLTINANGILEEAKLNLDKLELELTEQHQLPVDWFVG